ncbi:MAG: hypothetical protein AABW41_01720 [Nanoarchaeota archaeon]
MVIKVKEFRVHLGVLDNQVNRFIVEHRIKKIIDIKYVANSIGTFALLIYDD